MARPLAISGLGMVSCLASGAEMNAAAMRCKYSNFLPTDFYISNSMERQIGAKAEGFDLIGINHLIDMSTTAILQALEDSDLALDEIPLVVAFPSTEQIPNAWGEGFHSVFLQRLQAQLPQLKFSASSSLICAGRAGTILAINKLQDCIYKEGSQHGLLLGVDSLLNNHRMSLYQDLDEGSRMLNDDSPNGFIPGKAAVAVILSRPDGSTQTCITGVAYASEKITIYSDDILRATGLTEASQKAVKDAETRVCDTNFMLSSVNGESYFFKEVALLQSRALEEKIASFPLWHPADNIGEVGSAVGAAIIVMGHFAFKKAYAPGKRALCLLSNDNEDRGVFVLERK